MDYPIMSKEDFVKILNDIEVQRAKVSAFNDALDKICDGFIVFDSDNLYLTSLVRSLELIFKDTEERKGEFGTISWYLFEYCSHENEKNIYYNNYVANINTPEILYELLVSELPDEKDEYMKAQDNFFETFGRKMTEEEIYEHNQIPTIEFKQ